MLFPATSEELYFAEQSNHRLLSFDEEQRLVPAAQCGDQAALAELVELNQRLVAGIARFYQKSPISGTLDFMDLVQAGNLGLLHAIQKFDATRRLRFSTYATWWVRHYIRRYCQYAGFDVDIQYAHSEKLYKISRRRSSLYQELGREPSISEMSTQTGLNESQAGLLLAVQRSSSLDAPIRADTEVCFGEIIPSPDASPEAIVEKDILDAISAFLDQLAPQTKQALTLRYGLDQQGERSIAEVAALIGVTPTKADRILRDGLRCLRKKALYAGLGET